MLALLPEFDILASSLTTDAMTLHPPSSMFGVLELEVCWDSDLKIQVGLRLIFLNPMVSNLIFPIDLCHKLADVGSSIYH